MLRRSPRRRYFVDSEVQGALLVTILRYWLLSVTLVAGLTVLGWSFNSAGIESFVDFRQQLSGVTNCLMIAVVAALLVTPLILMDLLRMTNRFAGPMFRLRQAMNELADGKPVEPIQFRKGDFWNEYADAFNRVLGRLEQLQCSERTAKEQLNQHRNEFAGTNGKLAETLLR